MFRRINKRDRSSKLIDFKIVVESGHQYTTLSASLHNSD